MRPVLDPEVSFFDGDAYDQDNKEFNSLVGPTYSLGQQK